MKRTLWTWAFIVLSVLAFAVTPLLAGQKADSCAEKGIMVRNMTMLDLWYKKNGGDCFIWTHDQVFFIKPGDVIEIFSDLTCKTLYCRNNPAYKDYKALDRNRDCLVRILPECNVTDM